MRPNSPSDVFKRISVNENGCWIWQGNTAPNGYGLMRLNGKYEGSHRIAWYAFFGDIPIDLQIDHLCTIKNCVNPFHMELVTPNENLRRIFSRKSKCKNGHEKDIGISVCLICRKQNRLRHRPKQLIYLKKYNKLPKSILSREKWRKLNPNYSRNYYLKTKELTNAPTVTA